MQLVADWQRCDEGTGGEGGFLYFVMAAELACFHDFCGHLLTNPVRYINLCFLPSMGINYYPGQLPVCLIAQLVEHCNGITEAMGSNPIQA